MTRDPFDTLSAPARQIIADARAAGAYELLVVRAPQTRAKLEPLLERLSPDALFEARVTRPEEARCTLAGLWLLADDLDRSHRIVQDVATPSGSFWHAIVHRREGDFSNSRYWYARCAEHAVRRADALVTGPRLVELVERANVLPDGDPRRAKAVAAQRREWELLLDYSARQAVGAAAGGGG